MAFTPRSCRSRLCSPSPQPTAAALAPSWRSSHRRNQNKTPRRCPRRRPAPRSPLTRPALAQHSPRTLTRAPTLRIPRTLLTCRRRPPHPRWMPACGMFRTATKCMRAPPSGRCCRHWVRAVSRYACPHERVPVSVLLVLFQGLGVCPLRARLGALPPQVRIDGNRFPSTRFDGFARGGKRADATETCHAAREHGMLLPWGDSCYMRHRH